MDDEKKEMKVLFADDQADDFIARFNQHLGKNYGLTFVKELEAEKVLARIRQEKPDVLLLDILFPVKVGTLGPLEPKGKDIFSKVRRKYPNLPVVVLTSTLTDARYGINTADFPGAFLFEKDRFREDDDSNPYEQLAEVLLSAIEKANDTRPLDERFDFFIGKTFAMRRLAEKILRVAEGDIRVLLAGESGTGKELAARAIHENSSRRGKKFLAVNCGVPSGETLESQFFGNERGAFTGANQVHKGFFEQADGGTLFLDEVHAMSAALQDKLMRVIEDGHVRRMGAEKEISVDVRIIAATNKDLSVLVKKEDFREDLYYRLNDVTLTLLPLRERLGDLKSLCAFLIEDLNDALKKRPRITPEVRDDVLDKLKGHSWPGNIRELRKVLQRAMVFTTATSLTFSDIEIEAEGETPPTLPGGDWVDRILAGEVEWKEAKDIKGAPRRRIFEELIARMSERDGKPPTSAQLAALLKTTDNNMRRILSGVGIRLKDWK